jgi:hypothetical protein
MTYASENFRTKKAFRDAVTAGKTVRVYEPGGWPLAHECGKAAPGQEYTVYVEGPHYPEPHRWYATVRVKDGVVVSVK